MGAANRPPALSGYALFQAFFGAALLLFVLYELEQIRAYNGETFAWVMWRGGGTAITIAVFLGTLGYRLGREYLK